MLPLSSDGGDGTSSATIMKAISWYSCCSGFMLVVNKVALFHVPRPSLVAGLQLATCSAFVLALKAAGVLAVDTLQWEKVRPYLIYVVAFSASIYCNMRALDASNVETVIVFRSCTPVTVAVLDWAFLDRELPGGRSVAALLLILVGTFSYASTDPQFAVHGFGAYKWVSIYFVSRGPLYDPALPSSPTDQPAPISAGADLLSDDVRSSPPCPRAPPIAAS